MKLPGTFAIGWNAFFGAATNLCDDGMMIDESLARNNFLRILKPVVKTHEWTVEDRLAIEGRLFSIREDPPFTP